MIPRHHSLIQTLTVEYCMTPKSCNIQIKITINSRFWHHLRSICSNSPSLHPASNHSSSSQLKTCACLTTMGANTSAPLLGFVPVSQASLSELTERAASWKSTCTTDSIFARKRNVKNLLIECAVLVGGPLWDWMIAHCRYTNLAFLWILIYNRLSSEIWIKSKDLWTSM